MYETRNDLPRDVRLQLAALLNQRLADAIDLRTQMKVAHWNVKGPEFIALHKLFDDVAASVDEYVDLIAERAVQLGGIAEGTARQVAERTTLDEYAGSGSADQHVPAVADALADFGKGIRQATASALEAGDQDTADILIEISRGTDKWLWFVEAHLQAGPWSRTSAEEVERRAHPDH